MKFENIFQDITTSFGSLWKYKERGETVEIITPFATTTNKFVSVFITQQEGYFVVSDGGWMHEGNYDNDFDLELNCFSKIFDHYKEHFSVKSLKSPTGIFYFYKKTQKEKSIPSLVLDMGNFISSMISASEAEHEVEKTTKERFSGSANRYLSNLFSGSVRFNEYLGSTAKFNAIITKSNRKLALVNYITGSNDSHFKDSISKSNMLFGMARKTEEFNWVDNNIVILDVNAVGYVPEKVGSYLNHFKDNTERLSIISWQDKEGISSLIQNPQNN